MYPYANFSAACLTHKIEAVEHSIRMGDEWFKTPLMRDIREERLEVMIEERNRRLRFNGKLRPLPPSHRETFH